MGEHTSVNIESDKIQDDVEKDTQKDAKIDTQNEDKNSVVDKKPIYEDGDFKIYTSEKDKPAHDDSPITMLKTSPNGKYIVTYSKDNDTIVMWNNVKDKDEGKLEPDYTIKFKYEVDYLFVSDEKKLFLFGNYCNRMIDINNLTTTLEYLYLWKIYNCNFNLRGELIIHAKSRLLERNVILVLQIKNKKFKYKKVYDIPADYKSISISKDNKVYLLSNGYICELNVLSGDTKNILFVNDKKIETKDISISSNEKFIFVKIKEKITVYSIELEIPIPILGVNDITQLYSFMKKNTSYFSLFSLLTNTEIGNSIFKLCWDEYFDQHQDNNQLPNDYNLEIANLFDNIQSDTTRYLFGFINGYIYKFKVEESKFHSLQIISDSNSKDEQIVSTNDYLDNDKISNKEEPIYDYVNLNIYSFNADMNDIRKLFDEIDYKLNYYEVGYFRKYKSKKYLWIIKMNDEDIKLEVFKIKVNVMDIELDEDVEPEILVKRIEKYSYKIDAPDAYYHHYIITGRSLSNDDIIILTTIGIFIYQLDEIKNKITLKYFYYIKLEKIWCYLKDKSIRKLKSIKRLFSKSNHLPSPSFGLSNEWDSYLLNNKESFLKWGVEFLTFAIKERNFELVECIYMKSLFYFNQDLENNKLFLSIITSAMPLLNEYYPEYITRYSLETEMIIDSLDYNIEYHDNLNLDPYFNIKIVNLSNATFHLNFWDLAVNQEDLLYILLTVIIKIFMILILPLTLPIVYLLDKYHFIVNIELYEEYYLYVDTDLFRFYYKIFERIFKQIKVSKNMSITFIIPYIGYINYPKDYSWWKELLYKPESSPFVKSINYDIYKTWNGEALINFKWKSYGRLYYIIMWIGFMIFLGCFTAAIILSINGNYIKPLLIASIIFGCIHLYFELRQIIYNPIKWILNIWNLFDLGAYLVPTITSIYWLNTNNGIKELIAFSCLLLNFKFLLFFRVIESFGIYFAIIIGVGKRIISFLVVLFIIVLSFAQAFFILLKPSHSYSFDNPTFNDDSNNPWNLTDSYYQVSNNGTIISNEFFQKPDENTNMFIDFRTALLAIYLFLTGDSDVLTKWTYIDNPILVIIIVLFSLLVVIYLMNLFIGLLNMAIEDNNNKASYLVQKAEILAEIELFYLLPNQRRWKSWFPDHAIYYHADINKTKKRINDLMKNNEWKTVELKNNEWKIVELNNNEQNTEELKNNEQKTEELKNNEWETENSFKIMKQNLLKRLNIIDPADNAQLILDLKKSISKNLEESISKNNKNLEESISKNNKNLEESISKNLEESISKNLEESINKMYNSINELHNTLHNKQEVK